MRARDRIFLVYRDQGWHAWFFTIWFLMVFIKNQTISNSPKIWFFGFNTVYSAWTVQYGQVLHYIPVGIVEGKVVLVPCSSKSIVLELQAQ